MHVDKQPAALLLRLAHWPLPPPHITSDAMRPLCCREQSRAERRALQSGARITRVGASQSSSLLSLRCAALLSVYSMCMSLSTRLDSSGTRLSILQCADGSRIASDACDAMPLLQHRVHTHLQRSRAHHHCIQLQRRLESARDAHPLYCTVLFCTYKYSNKYAREHKLYSTKCVDVSVYSSM